MSKKHYVTIAREFRECIEAGTIEQRAVLCVLARSLAVEFKRDNPLFDRERFLGACGTEWRGTPSEPIEA